MITPEEIPDRDLALWSHGQLKELMRRWNGIQRKDAELRQTTTKALGEFGYPAARKKGKR